MAEAAVPKRLFRAILARIANKCPYAGHFG